jgi:hypothetical protein
MTLSSQRRVDFQGKQLAGDSVGIRVSARADGRVADNLTRHSIDSDQQLVSGGWRVQDRACPDHRQIVSFEGVEGSLGKKCRGAPSCYLNAGDVIDIGSSGKACTGGRHEPSLPQGVLPRCGGECSRRSMLASAASIGFRGE